MSLPQITDKNLATIADAPCGVLVLSKSDCGHCTTYADAIVAAQEAGTLTDVAVGKLVLDAPGAARFKLKNPWISKLPTLPYTLVFVDGKPVDHFSTSKVDFLQERIDAQTVAA